MKRAEADAAIRKAFLSVGYQFSPLDDQAVTITRLGPIVSVVVITLAPWLGPNRCDIVFEADKFSYRSLVRAAREYALSHLPRTVNVEWLIDARRPPQPRGFG